MSSRGPSNRIARDTYPDKNWERHFKSGSSFPPTSVQTTAMSLLVTTLSKISGCQLDASGAYHNCWASTIILAGAMGLLLAYYGPHYRYRLPLPPSPSKNWIWGNKDLIDKPYRYVLLGTEHKAKLGDIISLTTRSETVIVVNTIELATELLDKQAAGTANRPQNVMVQDILGWSTGTAFRQHDDRHKKLRRVMASALHPAAARAYASQHFESTLDLLRRIAAKPDDFATHTTTVVGDFIMKMAYGYRPVENDPILATIHQAFSYLVKGTSLYYLVNDFPILRYIPGWFPGGGFQVDGDKGKKLRERSANEPFNMVFEQVRADRVTCPSYTSRLLETKGGVNATEEYVELIKWTAGSMFTAGSTTSVGVVLGFVLLASLHPEATQRARAEIDKVVGRGRIPELKDRDGMPYMEAFLQEVLRMCPVVPMGLAHAATEGLQFMGYHIPKGATIYANIWAMLRDPKHFSNPNTFDPLRFLKPNPDPDPRKYIFGFGRRLCPGSHVANNSAWVMCTGILAVFDLQPSADLLAKVDAIGGVHSSQFYRLFQPHLVFHPLQFSCKFTPRDQAAIDLLEN